MKTQWTGRVVTDTRGDEARLFGLSVEFDSKRSAEAVYEYMQDQGEPVTMSRTSESLGDDRGETGDEGWITDEADVEIAAEYLYAAAHDEN